jgi:hypothetical protein
MQKTYLANIKIPFTLSPDGSMTPHQDRYAIDFQSIDELPPINREEHGSLLRQLLSSNNDAQSSENIREPTENIKEPDENIREPDDDSHIENKSSEPENHHPLMVSIREFMNRPSPKQSNTISFKNRPHSARKNRSAKKRPHPANDL